MMGSKEALELGFATARFDPKEDKKEVETTDDDDEKVNQMIRSNTAQYMRLVNARISRLKNF